MPYNARMTIPVRMIGEGSQRGAGNASLYETDFYSWTRDQAAALRRRDAAAIDWDNVIEEIESLGRSERSAWTNTVARAIEHMLKIEHWERAAAPDLRHWMGEIATWRDQMADTIQENPGLQGQYGEMLRLAWHRGRRGAIRALVDAGVEREGEARRKSLQLEWQARIPRQCPWRLDQIVAYETSRRIRRGRKRLPEPDPEVWPPPVARRLNAALGARFPESRARGAERGWSR